MINKRVKTAYLFDNGNLAVCDEKGEQIPELQGQYSIHTHKRILLEAMDSCEYNGFEILPIGFILAARDWANYFRSKNMSLEEINSL